MQALTTLPSKGDLWVVPKLGFELGSSCRIGSRRIKGLGFPVCHSRLLLSNDVRVARRGSCCGNSKLDLGCRCFKLKVALFCMPKKSPFGALVALAWALEQQPIGNEFLREGSDLVNAVSGETERKDGDYLVLGEADDSDDNEKRGDGDPESGEEEKNAKVDVRSLAWSLRFARTADDVEEVLKDKGELPLQVYSSMIRGFGRDKRMNSAIAVVEWLKKKKLQTNGLIGPNLFIYNSLLGAVKQSQKFGEMDKVLNDMAQEGVLPNVVTYNALMAIYLEQGRATEVLNILEEIQKKGLTPSPVSYSTTLLAYRKMEDGHGALRFFIEFREKYHKGDIRKDSNEDWENEFVKLEKFTIRVCYQVMRRWLVNAENLSTNVLKLLTDMDNAGLPLGKEEHERLLWACTREDHYIVVKDLYSRIRERHSEISLSVCNHAIWLMGKAKKWWAALEIYEDLLDKGPKPNNMSYELIVSHFNILLSAAKRKGIWRWGVRLLNKMEDKGLKPGSREWNAVLIACSKASETSAAVQIFRRMVEQGEKPTIISYGALLSALEKKKLYDEARQVWEHMIKVGVEPNVYAYTIMASVFTGQGKFNLVDAILKEMVSAGIEPTVVTYNAVISGCARKGMSSAVAYEWFHRMKVQNISPNEISYEMLIEALAKDGKPRIAYNLYLRAQNEGLNLSSKAYDAVLQSSQVYEATIDLSDLGPRPPDKKKRLQIRKSLTEFCILADVPRRSKPFDRKEAYISQTEGNP
jgi:pentatricopeptide repeat protein